MELKEEVYKDLVEISRKKISELQDQVFMLESHIQILQNNNSDKYEVLEYWGIMDAEYMREAGVDVPNSIDDLDEVQVNAWICNGKLLRVVVNPFTPHRLPYHSFPYERNPYSFFGIGVAENMDDAQQIMNGHARKAIT